VPPVAVLLIATGILFADLWVLAFASQPSPSLSLSPVQRASEAAEARVRARAVQCPGITNTKHFGDIRDRCATVATALPVGEVPASDLPCWVSSEEPAFTQGENSASVSFVDSGHPPRGQKLCDTYAGGGTALYFDFNTLFLNDPVFEDYTPRLPIGMVLDPTQPDCIPARACRKG
jgi:hypothetical protein